MYKRVTHVGGVAPKVHSGSKVSSGSSGPLLRQSGTPGGDALTVDFSSALWTVIGITRRPQSRLDLCPQDRGLHIQNRVVGRETRTNSRRVPRISLGVQESEARQAFSPLSARRRLKPSRPDVMTASAVLSGVSLRDQ